MKVTNINVDESKELVKRYNIRCVPTVLICDAEMNVLRRLESKDRVTLREAINQIARDPAHKRVSGSDGKSR